jgi:hypothetical protein
MILDERSPSSDPKNFLINKIKTNLDLWEAEVRTPTLRPDQATRQRHQNIRNADPDNIRARQAERKFRRLGDVRGAVRVLFSSAGIALFSPETLATLKTKHPPAPTPTTSAHPRVLHS